MKCLVTKLSGVVNNKSLYVIGEKRVTAKSPKGNFAVKYPASSKDKMGLSALDSDFNTLATASIPEVWEGTYYLNINSTNIDGVSYYSIKDFNSILQINFGNDIFSKAKFTLNNFKFCKQLQDITDKACALSGDLKELSELVTLINIDLTYNTNVTGDIASLGKLVKLKTLIINTSGEISATNVTGSIESLASKLVAAGRTEGKLAVSCYGCKITHTSKVIKSCKISFSSSNYEVSDVVYVEV